MKDQASKYKIKGPVESVIFEKTEMNITESNALTEAIKRIQVDEFLHNSEIWSPYELRFNKSGYLVLRKIFLSTELFFYDSNNQKKECKIFNTLFDIDEEKKPSEIITYVYYDDGLLKEEINQNYEYIDDLAEKLFISDSVESTQISEYYYNNAKQLIKNKKYSDSLKNLCVAIIHNKFDDVGNMIEQLKTSPVYTFGNYRKFFFYDSNNILIRKEWQSGSSIGFTETYRTSTPYSEDKIGLVEETNWTHHGEKITYSYKYNNLFDVTEIDIERKDLLNKNNPITSIDNIKYEYNYDQFDNWTQKNKFINGILSKTEKRIMTYFQNT